MGCASSNSSDISDPQCPAPKAEVIFVLGGPGSGKGTQCEKMVKDYCFNHISTGDLLRAERQKGGEDAEMIENLMKEGKLVPSDLLVKLIWKEIESNGRTGKYLLDGFPRSMENWQSWNKIIGGQVNIQFLLMFECSFEVMEKRLIKRGETSGRADDNAETIKKRFETFTNETQPIVEEFQKKNQVQKINSELSPEEVHTEVEKLLTSKGINKVEKPHVVFVLGGPGSGKGTQCEKLVRDFQFTHLSTGDLLRAELTKPGPLKQELDTLMKEGKLVPSDMVVKLIKKEFLRRQLKGKFLLDGFPRNKENMESWNKIMTPFAEIKFLMFFECSSSVMEQRLLERGKTSGRADDNVDTIKKRLETFDNETKPVLEMFKASNQLISVNSESPVELVYTKVRKSLKTLKYATRLDGSKALKQKYVVFVLGGPGSGKGTQCNQIVQKFGFTHLSTGDLLRAETKKKTPESLQIQLCMKEGKLVPSELLIKLVEKAIQSSSSRKFLLDGFPRNQENLDIWNKVIKHIKVKYLVFFSCSQETMTNRLVSRGASSGRADDNPETIKKRLEVFVQETEPIVQQFESEGKVIKINAEPESSLVFAEVEKQFVEKKLNR